MKERRRRNSNPKENPCLICGYEEYIWGTSLGGRNPAYFFPEGRGWFRISEPLHTRKCGWCGNVQFFSNLCDG
ncbi:MAG: hypothetical protein KI793_22410 [Rivularia sp. (in: Bacteria)]|nr:hypothetical protein [Rivularia sp. MS3]